MLVSRDDIVTAIFSEGGDLVRVNIGRTEPGKPRKPGIPGYEVMRFSGARPGDRSKVECLRDKRCEVAVMSIYAIAQQHHRKKLSASVCL